MIGTRFVASRSFPVPRSLCSCQPWKPVSGWTFPAPFWVSSLFLFRGIAALLDHRCTMEWCPARSAKSLNLCLMDFNLKSWLLIKWNLPKILTIWPNKMITRNSQTENLPVLYNHMLSWVLFRFCQPQKSNSELQPISTSVSYQKDTLSYAKAKCIFRTIGRQLGLRHRSRLKQRGPQWLQLMLLPKYQSWFNKYFTLMIELMKWLIMIFYP